MGVYCEPKGDIMCLVEGQVGGVTHIMFSPDGNKLYSGGRKVSRYLRSTRKADLAGSVIWYNQNIKLGLF